MSKRFILFDFDGVILDLFRAAFGTQKMLCPHLTEEGYRQGFEGNINDWVYPGSVHSEHCRHDADFFEHYIPRLKREARLVPGMDSVVRTLAQHYTLVIISSTLTSAIEHFFAGGDLTSRFARIMGNDVHTSKEEKIRMVFSAYDVTAADCVFVTDTFGDIREAAKVDVGAIAVTWGFHEAERLSRGQPFRLVDKPEDIPVAVGEYFEALKQTKL